MERVKQRQKEETSIDEDIPTAPTIEDFYYDPGIRERLAPSISGATDVPSLEQEVTESLSKMDLKGTYIIFTIMEWLLFAPSSNAVPCT